MEQSSNIRGLHLGKRRVRDETLPRIPGTPEQPKNKLPKTTHSPCTLRDQTRHPRTSCVILRQDVGSNHFTRLWRTLMESGRQFNFHRSIYSPNYDIITVRAADLVRLANDGSRILDLIEETTQEVRQNAENQADD